MQSIVLRRRDFREYDQIISLYTKEEGKRECLARGVKKITSKNAAHLEPFAYDMVEIVDGREIDHVTKVVPIDYFVSLRHDLQKSMAASFIVSLVDTLFDVGEPDDRLWYSLLSWLQFVDRSSALVPLLIDGMVVMLFQCLGFTPVLDRCVSCGKSFVDIVAADIFGKEKNGKNGPGYYFAGGGVVCADCRMAKEKIGEEIFACGLKEVSDMALLLKSDWRLIAEYELDEIDHARLHKLVYGYAVYHSERRVVDWHDVFPQ